MSHLAGRSQSQLDRRSVVPFITMFRNPYNPYRQGNDELPEGGKGTMRWDELCIARATPHVISTNARRQQNGEELPHPSTWTTSQLLAYTDGLTTDRKKAKILSDLRPEDCTHIPELRIDSSGTILDWNRSMADLTGISQSAIIGLKYEDVLRRLMPGLSNEYRNAAVKWVTSPPDAGEPVSRESYRQHYLFPLPLPLRRSCQSDGKCYYIELLATTANMYTNLDISIRPLLGEDYFPRHELKEWFGGAEFTLRRIEPRGMPMVPTRTNTSLDQIFDAIQLQNPTVLKYLKEVLFHLRSALRSMSTPRKIYTFTEDWSSCPETSGICEVFHEIIGGPSAMEQSVKAGKLTWRLASASKPKKQLRGFERFQVQANEIETMIFWEALIKKISPALAEASPPSCFASEAPNVLPNAVDTPGLTALTLKIECVDQNQGDYDEEPLEGWATIRVPADLNFFQLHRVVIQVMSLGPDCVRETHLWRATNVASCESKGVHKEFDHVQLGDTYFVDDGRRANYGDDVNYFKEGCALRQRVSHTGAYFDHAAPMRTGIISKYGSGIGLFQPSSREMQDKALAKVRACIHSTSIGAIFFARDTEATMEEGLVKWRAKYKLTCLRIDPCDGPPPENPNLNAFLPKCVRGKVPRNRYGVGFDWSPAKANEQLERDRGCLRRRLCQIGTPNGMQQFPWCFTGDPFMEDYRNSHLPIAARAIGVDTRPVFLSGEPPLPASAGGDADTYASYVTPLEDRIEDRFLQENVISDGHSFTVPFGKPGRYRSSSWDEAEDTTEGAAWEREVDEEDAQKPKAKAKARSSGSKRKSTED